jgi:hypothetical protein
MSSHTLDRESMIIKARHTNHGETTARRINVDKNIKLEELEYKVKKK